MYYEVKLSRSYHGEKETMVDIIAKITYKQGGLKVATKKEFKRTLNGDYTREQYQTALCELKIEAHGYAKKVTKTEKSMTALQNEFRKKQDAIDLANANNEKKEEEILY